MRPSTVGVALNFSPVQPPSQDFSLSSKLLQKLIEFIDQDCGAGVRLLLSDVRHLDMIVDEIKKNELKPLHLAVAQQKNQALSALLALLPLALWRLPESTMGFTPLLTAAQNGNGEFIEGLWDAIGNRLLENELSLSTLESDYALYSLMGEFNCVSDVGRPAEKIWKALVDVKDDQGNTPVLLAVKNNHVKATVLLVKLGADYTMTNSLGESARGLAFSLPANPRIQRLFEVKPYFTVE